MRVGLGWDEREADEKKETENGMKGKRERERERDPDRACLVCSIRGQL
jgi:hypothetical protein